MVIAYKSSGRQLSKPADKLKYYTGYKTPHSCQKLPISTYVNKIFCILYL